MIIKLHCVSNKLLKRFLEHIMYLLIIFFLVPGFFYFEICVVIPAVENNATIQVIHLLMALFLLSNIIGNLIYGMFTDSSIKGRILSNVNSENWTLCTFCECMCPPRAWHCEICDICVLKRDHHCTFLACCVGYFNYRYFLMFTLHIFISMVYAFYFNVKFLALFVTWNHGLAIIRFIFPLANFITDFSFESLYIVVVLINVIVAVFTGFLFFYHMNNVIKGKTTPEMKKSCRDFPYNKGLKSNLEEVFGSRWYITWISPCIQSDLPGNGTQWLDQDKHK